MSGEHPETLHGTESRVLQPDEMMKERGLLPAAAIRKLEMIAFGQLCEQFGRVKRVGAAVMHQAGGAAEAVKETIGNVYENIQERF